MDHIRSIRLARPDDVDAISSLRLEEYTGSRDFSIKDTAFVGHLNWSDEDEKSYVLTVWSNGFLLATMRASFITDRQDAVKHFDGFAPPLDHNEWPSPVLERGATRASLQRSGLNSLMRYYFLEAAIESRFRRIYGYVPFGGSRTRLLESLGYNFFCRPDQDVVTPSHFRWAIAWLDIPSHGHKALNILKQFVGREIRRYPWTGTRLGRLASFNCTIERR